MKSRVRRLLDPPSNTRKTFSVSMNSEQMEMVDKLALFFAEKTGQKVSRNQMIEEAVGGFIDDSMEVIREKFDMDIRMIPLAELEHNRYQGITDVTELDTVIVPAKDNDLYREAFFIKRRWRNVRIVEEKLQCMRYLAVYVGAPTSGITHVAQIASYHKDPDNPGRYTIELVDTPQPLPNIVVAGDPAAAAGMRSCRYTAINILRRAHTIQELFEPMTDE